MLPDAVGRGNESPDVSKQMDFRNALKTFLELNPELKENYSHH